MFIYLIIIYIQIKINRIINLIFNSPLYYDDFLNQKNVFYAFVLQLLFEDFKDELAFTFLKFEAISVVDHAWYLQPACQPFQCIKKSFTFCKQRLVLHGNVLYS